MASYATRTLLFDDFSADNGNWEIVNHENRLRMDRTHFHGKTALVITPADSQKERDTAFMLSSKVFPLEAPSRYALSFEAAANYRTVGFKGYKARYRNLITFFDGFGMKIGEQLFRYDAHHNSFQKSVVTGLCPAGTKGIAISFGVDHPNVAPGRHLALTNIKLQVLDGSKKWPTESAFVSGIFPISGKESAAKISWKLAGAGAAARFQIATAPDNQGFPGAFTQFCGPDGTEKSWFTHSGAKLPPFPAGAKWLRYKAQLRSSDRAPAILSQVAIGAIRDGKWTSAFDVDAPQIIRTSPSPVADGKLPLTLQVLDDNGVDWSTAQFTLDNQPIPLQQISPIKNGIAINPAGAFAQGIHELKIKLSDLNGNEVQKFIFFRIGQKATQNIVTIRDDGMTLIDGKPFFPIGVYNVTPHQFHGGNIDNSFAELKKAGINFVHTYRVRRDDAFRKFMTSAANHGMKIWIASEGDSNDSDLSRIARSLAMDIDNSALLAWYIADDTIVYNAPWQLRDRTELVKALAPHLITVHADEVWDEHYGSKFRDFADTALAFLPEIYPVHYLGDEDTRSCVAKVIRDMEQIKADIREKKLSPRSIWPIIQYFHGWSWERFPTPTELRATSFASLIHGGHGITWYTYNSSGKNRGVTASPEIWKNFTAVTSEISSYAEVLTERDATQQFAPIITAGPTKNVLGGPAISALTKVHKGKKYLFCVNAVMEKVKVQFKVPGIKSGKDNTSGAAVAIDNGVLNVDFEPYAVKIFVLE